tara:strand:+ start:547 stop:789 length:243 start_codon:yes stop_codon:yes gene_type:complete
MEELLQWLLGQPGMIIIMGVVIWWLQRKLLKVESEKDKLSQDVIKLTTTWENKAVSLGDGDKDFKEKVLALLNEIKGIVK